MREYEILDSSSITNESFFCNCAKKELLDVFGFETREKINNELFSEIPIIHISTEILSLNRIDTEAKEIQNIKKEKEYVRSFSFLWPMMCDCWLEC